MFTQRVKLYAVSLDRSPATRAGQRSRAASVVAARGLRPASRKATRCVSSRKRRGFQLDALPFTVTPADAHAKFGRWANDEQGLGPLLSIGTTRIAAAYAPFWCFDLNMRFVAVTKTRAMASVIPEPFRSAFPNPPNGVIHLPGMAAYSGYSYRRSLIDPVHNTTLVFRRKDIKPFGNWMIEPLRYDQTTLDVFPDPWNASRERAFSVICDELLDMANDQYREQTKSDHATTSEIRVETQRLTARRVYMPTYIVEYTILGVTYQAFLSGCDDSIQVSGISHKTIFSAGSKGEQVLEGANSFLSSLPRRIVPTAATALQMFGLKPFVAVAQLALNIISRVAMRFPIIGLFSGAFLAWKKILRPYMDSHAASTEWERQRDHEAQMNEQFHEDSFWDDGSAKAYFTRNEARILASLSGEGERQHDQESNAWYEQWEQWAREQVRVINYIHSLLEHL